MCQIFFFLAVLPFKRNLITDIDTLTKKMGQILRKTIFQYHILEFKNEWKKCNKRNFGEICKFNFLIYPVFSHYSNHYLQRILHWKKVMSSENNKKWASKVENRSYWHFFWCVHMKLKTTNLMSYLYEIYFHNYIFQN